MGKASALSAAILFLAACGDAVACRMPEPTVDLAHEAEAVAIGTVTRTEIAPPTPGAALAGAQSTNSRSARDNHLYVYVKVTTRLLGDSPATVRAISPCSFPLGVGERAVVVSIRGVQVAYSAQYYEGVFRKVHRPER